MQAIPVLSTMRMSIQQHLLDEALVVSFATVADRGSFGQPEPLKRPEI